MGVWGKVSTLWRGRPKPPKFQQDPFLSSPGFQQGLQGVNDRYTQRLMEYLNRSPGFSEEEIGEMYALPAEQTKAGEATALRRINQGAAYRGGYHGGARRQERGRVMMQGMSTRADLRRRTRLAAAQAALQDRISQLQAAGGYVNPRMSASLAQTGMMNDQAMQSYMRELSQYNDDFGFAWNLLLGGLKSGGQGWAGNFG